MPAFEDWLDFLNWGGKGFLCKGRNGIDQLKNSFFLLLPECRSRIINCFQLLLLGFQATMGRPWTWSRINFYLLKLLLSRHFITATRKETKHQNSSHLPHFRRKQPSQISICPYCTLSFPAFKSIRKYSCSLQLIKI